MPQRVQNLVDYRKALSSRSVVLTYFHSEDCAPCKALAPQLDVFERQFSKALFVLVDVDKGEEVAAQAKVQGLPTVTFHCDAQRLEPSTVRGDDSKRIYHTLSNLLRPYQDDRRTSKLLASAPPPVAGKSFPAASKSLPPKEMPNQVPKQEEPRRKLSQRQVLFEPPHSIPAAAPNTSSAVVQIRDSDHYIKEVQSAEGLVVIDFNATWCGPCRSVKPVYEALALRMPHVKFLSVDVEQCKQLAEDMKVRNLPTFMIGRDGEQKETFSGADTSYLEQQINYWATQS